MKELARDNMPFMGLEIHGLEDIKLAPDLPHTTGMRQRGIRIRNMDELLNAKLDSQPVIQQQQQQGDPHPLHHIIDDVSPGGSRRSSAAGSLLHGRGGAASSSIVPTPSKAKKDLMLPPVTSRKGSLAVDPKGLPIITEKSDTQSVITEASSN